MAHQDYIHATPNSILHRSFAVLCSWVGSMADALQECEAIEKRVAERKATF